DYWFCCRSCCHGNGKDFFLLVLKKYRSFGINWLSCGCRSVPIDIILFSVNQRLNTMSLSFLLQVTPDNATTNTGVRDISLWEILKGSESFGNEGIGWSGWVICAALTVMLGYAVFIFVERYLALKKASR